MSKIQNMGVGAYDVYCKTKRVFWRPVTASTVVKVGQPVCYNSDAVVDHKERAAHPNTGHLNGEGATSYAEGSQTYTGRLFIVEEPLTANLMSFAGVVKSLGPKLGADGDMIEIFVPTKDAVVPVWTDQNCTLNVTVLGISNAEVDMSAPGVQKMVAMETVDRSSTNGLVWAKFLPSIYQSGEENEGTSASVKNLMYQTFNNTSGLSANLLSQCFHAADSATNGTALTSVLAYLDMQGAYTMTTSYMRNVLAQMNLSGTINGSNIHIASVHAQFSGSPTFTECSKAACLWADIGLGVAPTTGDLIGLRISNNGTNQIEVKYGIELYGGYGINKLFNFDTCAGITANFISNGGTGDTTLKTGDDWKKIKVEIDGTDYYLIAMNDPTES